MEGNNDPENSKKEKIHKSLTSSRSGIYFCVASLVFEERWACWTGLKFTSHEIMKFPLKTRIVGSLGALHFPGLTPPLPAPSEQEMQRFTQSRAFPPTGCLRPSVGASDFRRLVPLGSLAADAEGIGRLKLWRKKKTQGFETSPNYNPVGGRQKGTGQPAPLF